MLTRTRLNDTWVYATTQVSWTQVPPPSSNDERHGGNGVRTRAAQC